MASDDLSSLQPLAFSIAYRMLGSVTEAEDIVQEASLRLHRASMDGVVVSPKSYLATITTRLAIDHLRSARVRRETYFGDWLPEPLVAVDATAGEELERTESISLAFLTLLETISPVERAVFVLREAFDYDYDAIAGVIGKTPANVRQILARARRRIEKRLPRFEPDRHVRDELAQRFVAACQDGRLEDLVDLLADGAVVHGDGGGKAAAIVLPVRGRLRVARLLLGILSRGRVAGVRMIPVEVNGQPGAMLVDGQGRTISVMAFQIHDGRVQAIRSVVNPDKLRHVGPVSDLALLPRERAARGRS